MSIPSHEEGKFPQDLEGRINSVSNVFNTEFKLVTLLHLDEEPASGWTIRKRIQRTVGEGVDLPVATTFNQYAKHSLFPMGAVAREKYFSENIKKTITGYKLTEAGKKYFLPIGAFTLAYVGEHKQSMYPILGSSSGSGSTKSPKNSLDILKILERGPLKMEDFAKEFSMDPNLALQIIPPHIKLLSRAGFLEYESAGEVRKGISLIGYCWVEGKNPSDYVDSRFPSYGRAISKLLYERGKGSAFELADISGLAYTGVSRALSNLSKCGFAVKAKWEGSRRSEARLTQLGMDFLSDYVNPVIDALNNGPWLGKMQDSYVNLMKDPVRFRILCATALELYSDISPNLNRKSPEEVYDRIKYFLFKNPGSRPVEIEKSLSIAHLDNYLEPLLSGSVLRKERHGREVRYFLSESA